MSYKVTCINAVINKKNNTAMDTVWFFDDEKTMTDWIASCDAFSNHRGEGKEVERTIEECSAEEEAKYVFSQHHPKYNPQGMQIPNIVIEHPIDVPVGVPYWVTKRELVINS